MNRAERRRLAKAEQKKAAEKTVNIKPSELEKYRQDTLNIAVDGYFEMTTMVYSYVLLDEFGFNGEQIMDAMQRVNQLYDQIGSGEISIEDIENRLDVEADVQLLQQQC